MFEDSHLMMRQQGLVEGGLCFNDIRSRDRRCARRQGLERQQDCGLSIASRRGLLRKERKRKGLGAQRLIAGLQGFLLRRLGLVSAYLRQCRVPRRFLLSSKADECTQAGYQCQDRRDDGRVTRASCQLYRRRRGKVPTLSLARQPIGLALQAFAFRRFGSLDQCPLGLPVLLLPLFWAREDASMYSTI